MRNKHLVVLLVSVVVLFTALVLHTFGVTGTGRKMEFQTVEKGYYSGHTDSAYYIINDAEKWTEVWDQHARIMYPRPPPPDIDFSKTTIIAVFMGQLSTGGYGIEVKEMIDTGLSVVVKVAKTYPGKGCIVTEALSQPFHIVEVDKIGKNVFFNTIARITECGS